MNKVPSSLASLMALVALAGCGGGGGDTTTVSSSPSSAPAASGPAAAPGPANAPSPATATPSASGPVAPGPVAAPAAGPAASPPTANPPAATPAAFGAFGPITVATGLTVAEQAAPAVARLAGGGSVVAWGNNGSVSAQILANSGEPSGAVITFATGGSASVAVAGLANGEWILAWDAVTLPASAPIAQRTTVQFRRYSAAGTLVQDTTTVANAVFSVKAGMQAVATADGGFAIAFGARDVVGSPDHIFAQRYGASGNPLGVATTVSARPGEQALPQLASLPDGSTALVWLQRFGSDNTIFMRRIDAAGLPGDEVQVVGASSAGATGLAASGLPDGRIAISFTTADLVAWQIFNAAAIAQSTLRTASVAASAGTPTRVAITPRVAGEGFHVLVGTFLQFPRGINQNLLDYEVGGDSTLQATNQLATASVSTVSPTTGDVTGPAAAGFGTGGGSDGHFVYAWESASGVGLAQLDVAGR